MKTGRGKTVAAGYPRRRTTVAAAVALLLAALTSGPAFALSEIKREELPPPQENAEEGPKVQPELENREAIPLPDPIDEPSNGDEAMPEGGTGDPTRRVADPETPVPEVVYDVSLLPEPVRRMRELIMEACRAGDIEALRPLLGIGDDATQLSFGGTSDDPIETLRGFSGDDQGHEILAIMLEVLEAGFVRLEAGTPSELYVWPYFFAVPLDKLTARQRVELFKIVTAGDYEDMRTFGAYIFYRAGITPEGRWLFFVAGD